MLRYEPDFGRGHILLARTDYFNGRFEQADIHYGRAFEIMTGYAKKASNPIAEKYYLSELKEILFGWAQTDCAMGQWIKGLDKYKRAVVIDGKDPSLYNNIAFVYFHLGDRKNTYLSLKQALRIDPTFVLARRNLQGLGLP
jgi:tetratricopeptide (TPR) repeat protein